MKGDTVHVVLFVGGGIPEDPEIFTDEFMALDRYRELAKDRLNINGAAVGDMTDDELFEAVHDRQDSDDDLYLYELEVE